MKSRFRLIILTFFGTTAFWCVIVASAYWLGSRGSGVILIENAQARGFTHLMMVRNPESEPVTFIVEDLGSDGATTNAPKIVLAERQLPPSGEFWVGLRKVKE